MYLVSGHFETRDFVGQRIPIVVNCPTDSGRVHSSEGVYRGLTSQTVSRGKSDSPLGSPLSLPRRPDILPRGGQSLQPSGTYVRTELCVVMIPQSVGTSGVQAE